MAERVTPVRKKIQDLAAGIKTGNSNGSHPAGRNLDGLTHMGTAAHGASGVLPAGLEGFDAEALVGIYRTMLTARRLDEKMMTLLKQGKGNFHVGCSGHEAIQIALGLLSRPGHDWFVPYYRDLALVLTLGQTVRETLLDHLAKADSPNSGGRQMPSHYSHPDKNIYTVASSVGAQWLPGLGAAMAVQRLQNDAYVLCCGGDGATSQGTFHEALNWAARTRAPILFLIQDNKYAISVPVEDQVAGGTPYKLAAGYEGLARYRVDGTDFFESLAVAKSAIHHIREGNGPVCLVADVVRLLPHSSSDNHLKYRSSEELQRDRKVDPVLRMEETLLHAEVLTPGSATALRAAVHQEVDEAAAWAETQPDPLPASATRHVYYEGPPVPESAAEETLGEPVVMVDAINHALLEEMERDERVIVFGEDVAGEKGGVFTATKNLTTRFGQERCFNAPLAEASIVGTAVGLSAAGYKPVIEIQFADYIWPGMQQLRNQAAVIRYRSNNRWSCPMVVRVPCGGYIHGGLCHSQNIESIFGHTPGLYVAMPSTAADAKALLKAAIRGHDPVLFLEHKALYRSSAARTPEPGPDYVLPLGQAAVRRPGTDLTIVTYGMLVHKCLHVARQIAKEDGAEVEVLDLRTMMPLDSRSILDSVKRTNRVLVAYEDHEFIGFGAEISAQIADRAFEYLDAPIRRVAGDFTFVPFSVPLEYAVLPQDEDILRAARSLLAY